MVQPDHPEMISDGLADTTRPALASASDLTRQVGRRIGTLRTECGMSKRQLATMSGCSYSQVYYIELGRPMTLTTLEKLASALNVMPYQLLLSDTEISVSESRQAAAGADHYRGPGPGGEDNSRRKAH